MKISKSASNWKFKLGKDFDFTIPHKLPVAKTYLMSGDRVIGYAEQRNNRIYIKIIEGYAWDGATPKFSVLDLFWIGTPDGCLYEGVPKLYYPTLIHDFLLQFRRELNLTRKQCDDRFLEEMRKKRFLLRGLYYWAVRIFGTINIFGRK